MKRASGLALIVVVGVLGVLSVLAVAFVTMAQLERKASLQRVTAAKAYMLARSGIEDAQARLGMGQDPLASSNRYAGEDWNANGTLDAGIEVTNEVYHATGAGTPPDTDACPVRYAMRPSFFVGPPTAPSLVQVDGWARGFSGRLTGDSGPQGNHYVLKVEGASGFYVNGGDPNHHSYPTDPTATTDYNTMLRRMLGSLAEAIDREPDGVTPHGNLVAADGWALIDQRPRDNTGWQSFNQIRDLALGGNQAKMDALKPYLTLRAWVDKHVIAPNVTDAIANTWNHGYNSWGDIKLAHKLNSSVANSHAPDFERGSGGQIVGRAPVDLAWARTRRPVLIALMANLKGLFFDETTQAPDFGWLGVNIDGKPFSYENGDPDIVGSLRPAQITLDWSQPTDDCRTAVSALMTWTSPIGTWQQFSDFCDTVPFPSFDPNWDSADSYGPDIPPNGAIPGNHTLRHTWTSDLLQAKKDLLKANFNPNSDLNKFNPNPSRWKLMDKSDLLGYSTEFSLLPLEQQEMSCMGRVLNAQGKLLATRTLSAFIGGPSVVRLSTQREFVCDNLGDLNTPGDETNFRPLGSGSPLWWGGVNTPYISLNKAPSGEQTWGQALPGASPNGISLQSYPEPYFNTGGGATINPADYDGGLQLATLETPSDFYYSVDTMIPAPPSKSVMMLARFDDTLDLSVPPTKATAANQPDTYQVTTAQLGTGLLQETSPGSKVINTLYPDGCYSELYRTPAYLDQGNAHGYHGTLSFWVKNSYTRVYFRGRIYLRRTHFHSSDWTTSSYQDFIMLDYIEGSCALCQRAYYTGFDSGRLSAGYTSLFQTATPLDNTGNTDVSYGGHRWRLFTFGWDGYGLKDPADPSNTDNFGVGEFYVDAGSPDAVHYAPRDTYPRTVAGFPHDNDPNYARDLTAPDDAAPPPSPSPAPHKLVLGLRDSPHWNGLYVGADHGLGPDATFDEFVIYDFGGAVAPPGDTVPMGSQAAPGKLASNRYQIGRYYRESTYKSLGDPSNTAAEWFSAPLNLPSGSVIQSLSWTQIVPRGLKAPLPAQGQDGPAHAGWDGDPDTGDDPGDGRIVFDLADTTGTAYAKDTSSPPQPINTLFTQDARSVIGRAVSAPFRLHAVFQPNLANRGNTPILDPLALDDVTLVYQPPSGRGVSSWQEGE